MTSAKREVDIPSQYAGYRDIFSSLECAPLHDIQVSASNRGVLSDFVKQIVVARYVASFREFSDQLVRGRLRQKFDRLATEWSRDAAHYSSIEDMCMHTAYQRIIGMGPKVVPLILRELEWSPDHWFWALTSITEDNPVPEESWGRLDEMTTAWLDWGRENGFSW